MGSNFTKKRTIKQKMGDDFLFRLAVQHADVRMLF